MNKPWLHIAALYTDGIPSLCYMGHLKPVVFVLILAWTLPLTLTAQNTINKELRSPYSEKTDSLRQAVVEPSVRENIRPVQDSIAIIQDTTLVDSADILDAPIQYKAQDSIVMTGDGIVMFHGKGDVTYGDINLTSDYLKFNTNNHIITAHGVEDSSKVLQGKPIFKEGGSQFESHEMNYSLKTKKGFIREVTSEQGEGFITSTVAKKDEHDVICMQHGRYTTCNHHDHPHFYIALSKAKIRPGKTTVSGPAHLVIEDVHLPIYIPFGFFPSTESYSSGIIMPTFGEESTRGYYLQGLGYYVYINDHVDFELSGDIYGNASWGLRGQSSYKKRYKYSGNLNLSYQNTKTSEKGLNDYAESKDFRIQWSHRKDRKASPFSSFTAGVNYSTSTYNRNNVNNYYNPEALANSQTQSSITYSKTWPESPWSLNASMRASQNNRDTSVTLSLPQVSLNMSRIYPLKRKNSVGKAKWYEKIGLDYSANLTNSIKAHEDEVWNASLIKDWQNGMDHKINASTSFNLLNIFMISPSFNYNERWNTLSYRKAYNDSSNTLIPVDTVYGFHRNYNYNFSVGTSTKVYGFYRPSQWLNKLIGNKIEAIRHMMTPSASFSIRPDFSDPRYGFYEPYEYLRQTADGYELHEGKYSIYEGSYYGGPPRGGGGSIGLSLANTLEMKVLNSSDTTSNSKFKKIKILEALNFSTSYDLEADSFNWSSISATARTKVAKGLSIQASAVFDPYSYVLRDDKPYRVSTSYWQSAGRIAHMTNASASTSYSFNNETFNAKKKKTPKKSSSSNTSEDDLLGDDIAPQDARNLSAKQEDKSMAFDEDGYSIFTIPWNLSFTYRFNLIRDDFNKSKMTYNLKTNHNLTVNGSIQPTSKMNLNLSTGYDFQAQELSTTSLTFTRDLHCWSLNASVTLAPFKSYNVGIRVSSSILQDLKYDKRNDPRRRNLF